MSLPRLTFDEFCEAVTRALGLGRADCRADARLEADLGLDSFGLLELLALMDELGGVSLPDELLPELATLGDVYYYYDTHLGHRLT